MQYLIRKYPIMQLYNVSPKMKYPIATGRMKWKNTKRGTKYLKIIIIFYFIDNFIILYSYFCWNATTGSAHKSLTSINFPFSLDSAVRFIISHPQWEKKNPRLALCGSASVSENLWWSLWSRAHCTRGYYKNSFPQVIFIINYYLKYYKFIFHNDKRSNLFLFKTDNNILIKYITSKVLRMKKENNTSKPGLSKNKVDDLS